MKQITFYDGGCADCQKVAAFFSAHGIDYTRKNVKAHPQLLEELKAKGTSALPAVLVNNEIITGWNEQALKRAIGI